MSTDVKQDDLSFLLKRHAELEEKYGDGDEGRFLSGWQCENPWIERIRNQVDEQRLQIADEKYSYLDDDSEVKAAIRRFHRSIEGLLPDELLWSRSIAYHFCFHRVASRARDR